MKHKLSISLTLLTMFLLTQAIGLFVIHQYTNQQLPFGLDDTTTQTEPTILSIILSFALAFALLSILMKYRWKIAIKTWFLIVIALALSLSLNAILSIYFLQSTIYALAIAIPLAILKTFRPTFIIHNTTELLIYPGIAAVFVPILTPTTIIILLILISIYDAWAVWKSGIMQKMAKFQMEEIKIFGGFMIPSATQKIKTQIKKIKQKYKNKKMPNKIKNKKFKINMAILGGGDVVFPIITAGVYLRSYGLTAAIFIILGAFAGLLSIFLTSKKDKAYPAMPYITTGILAGLLLWKLLF
jgi:presenilin-like A22 family membrane protease